MIPASLVISEKVPGGINEGGEKQKWYPLQLSEHADSDSTPSMSIAASPIPAGSRFATLLTVKDPAPKPNNAKDVLIEKVSMFVY